MDNDDDCRMEIGDGESGGEEAVSCKTIKKRDTVSEEKEEDALEAALVDDTEGGNDDDSGLAEINATMCLITRRTPCMLKRVGIM
jgi:hypothetical protein